MVLISHADLYDQGGHRRLYVFGEADVQRRTSVTFVRLQLRLMGFQESGRDGCAVPAAVNEARRAGRNETEKIVHWGGENGDVLAVLAVLASSRRKADPPSKAAKIGWSGCRQHQLRRKSGDKEGGYYRCPAIWCRERRDAQQPFQMGGARVPTGRVPVNFYRDKRCGSSGSTSCQPKPRSR